MQRKKLLIYGGLGLLIILLILDEENKVNYWNDRLLPAVDIRCLHELQATDSDLQARQLYCRCVSGKFEGFWKSDEVFQTQLGESVTVLRNTEASLKGKARRNSLELAEGESDLFRRDLLMRLGARRVHPKLKESQDLVLRLVEGIYQRAQRACLRK